MGVGGCSHPLPPGQGRACSENTGLQLTRRHQVWGGEESLRKTEVTYQLFSQSQPRAGSLVLRAFLHVRRQAWPVRSQPLTGGHLPLGGGHPRSPQ